MKDLPVGPPSELDEEKPAEITKRDKRRAKESRRKAEEDAQRAVLKEERKSGRKAKPKADTAAQQTEKLQKSDDFITPKRKGKSRVTSTPDDGFTEEKAAKVVEAVTQYRTKIVDRWGEAWTRECQHIFLCCFAGAALTGIDFWHSVHRVYCPPDTSVSPPQHAVPGLRLLCLGLGKPYSDRSAQIQLALLLELSSRLQVRPRYTSSDPVLTFADLLRHKRF